MMVLPIALISFLPLSTDLRAESPNTVNISQQIKKLVKGAVDKGEEIWITISNE